MNPRTLQSLARLKGLSQSELARRVGVSRQLISQWFRTRAGEVDTLAKTQQRLARALGCRWEDLECGLPVVDNQEAREALEVELLWDQAYPHLEAFVLSLLHNDPRALARLVQVFDLYQSEKVVGKQVWKRFPYFRKYMHPSAARKNEVLWQINQQV